MAEETEKRGVFRPPMRTGSGGARGLLLLYAPRGGTDIKSAIPISEHAPLVIGREAPPGGLTIADGSVSRLHARITAAGSGVTIADLGSRNGLLVNGALVTKAELSEDDEVRIGDAIFKLVVGDLDGYAKFHPGDTALANARPFVGGFRMARLRDQIARVAPSELSILVQGESGTGKELVARALHEASGRTGKLCALNCAAIPANLVESELFGFRRGAFTGADRDHTGVVRAAHGGTLFLDEIGDMPLEAQAKLLRLIETREVVPLGSTTAERVDVRIVAATHRDLRALSASGGFRGDLFARLDGFTLELPPLRRRKEDLLPLVRHFLAACGRADVEPDVNLMTAIVHYSWPYNVRELEAIVRRCVTLAGGGPLSFEQLPSSVVDAMASYGEARGEVAPPPSSNETPSLVPGEMRGRTDASTLRGLLEKHAGNVSAVARELGKDRALVYRWIRQNGLDPEAFRPEVKPDDPEN